MENLQELMAQWQASPTTVKQSKNTWGQFFWRFFSPRNRKQPATFQLCPICQVTCQGCTKLLQSMNAKCTARPSVRKYLVLHFQVNKTSAMKWSKQCQDLWPPQCQIGNGTNFDESAAKCNGKACNGKRWPYDTFAWSTRDSRCSTLHALNFYAATFSLEQT